MTLWWVIWIFLSLFLLSFLGWTMFILFQQKATWKKFATTYKLRFNSNALMQVPDVTGSINGHKISIFESEHFTPDARGSRKMSAIEIGLNSTMPIDGAIANTGMVNFVKALEFKTEIRPKHERWHTGYVAAGDSSNALRHYLNDERLVALSKLMKSKKLFLIFIFRKNQMLLRVDTPDPLQDFEYLDKLVKAMIKVAGVMELKQGESAQLKREAAKAEARDVSLEVDEDALDAPVALELEGEGEGDVQDVADDVKPETSKE